MKRIAGVVLACAALLTAAGCGGSSAASAVSETTDNLAKIRSGVLDLKLLVTPRSGDAFGFELKGPFSLRPGKLPVARIEYTQTANGRSATATFVSDGARAWVVANGTTTELSEQQAASLTTLGGNRDRGLAQFEVGRWLRDPQVADEGDSTERITGTLDVVAAANDLMGLAALAGRDSTRIEGADADRLREATRDSSVEVVTGKDDRLLRRLALSADLGFDVPQSLEHTLGTTVGAKIEFLLAVDRPNTPVQVRGP